MSKPKHTAKLVITSIITSIIVVAIIALLFVKFLVPIYNISEDAIYSVLIKLFPLILGFVLIQIGVMAGKKNEDDYKDQIDKLPPNAYSDPLMTTPSDDPSATSYGPKEMPIKTQTIETVVQTPQVQPTEIIKEVVKPVTVETIKEIPVEILKVETQTAEVKTIVEVPVEKVVTVPAQEIEVIKEVPVEVVKEIVKEVPIEVIKEVPVEVIKEIIKEVPVEVVKEVEKPVEAQTQSYVEDVELTLDEIIEAELVSAKQEHYDFSMLYMYNDNNLTEDSIKATIGEDYVFAYQLGFLVLLPFNNEAETDKIREKVQAAFKDATISQVTQSGNKDKDTLLKALF